MKNLSEVNFGKSTRVAEKRREKRARLFKQPYTLKEVSNYQGMDQLHPMRVYATVEALEKVTERLERKEKLEAAALKTAKRNWDRAISVTPPRQQLYTEAEVREALHLQAHWDGAPSEECGHSEGDPEHCVFVDSDAILQLLHKARRG